MQFFKYGIEFFDGKLPQYGGHGQWMSSYFDLDYLMICTNHEASLDFYKFLKGDHKGLFKRQCTYYDGFHHHVNLVFLMVCWGGRPYIETDDDDMLDL